MKFGALAGPGSLGGRASSSAPTRRSRVIWALSYIIPLDMDGAGTVFRQVYKLLLFGWRWRCWCRFRQTWWFRRNSISCVTSGQRLRGRWGWSIWWLCHDCSLPITNSMRSILDMGTNMCEAKFGSFSCCPCLVVLLSSIIHSLSSSRMYSSSCQDGHSEGHPNNLRPSMCKIT